MPICSVHFLKDNSNANSKDLCGVVDWLWVSNQEKKTIHLSIRANNLSNRPSGHRGKAFVCDSYVAEGQREMR